MSCSSATLVGYRLVYLCFSLKYISLLFLLLCLNEIWCYLLTVKLTSK